MGLHVEYMGFGACSETGTERPQMVLPTSVTGRNLLAIDIYREYEDRISLAFLQHFGLEH